MSLLLRQQSVRPGFENVAPQGSNKLANGQNVGRAGANRQVSAVPSRPRIPHDYNCKNFRTRVVYAKIAEVFAKSGLFTPAVIKSLAKDSIKYNLTISDGIFPEAANPLRNVIVFLRRRWKRTEDEDLKSSIDYITKTLQKIIDNHQQQIMRAERNFAKAKVMGDAQKVDKIVKILTHRNYQKRFEELENAALAVEMPATPPPPSWN